MYNNLGGTLSEKVRESESPDPKQSTFSGFLCNTQLPVTVENQACK